MSLYTQRNVMEQLQKNAWTEDENKTKNQNKKWNSKWILDYDPDFESQNTGGSEASRNHANHSAHHVCANTDPCTLQSE